MEQNLVGKTSVSLRRKGDWGNHQAEIMEPVPDYETNLEHLFQKRFLVDNVGA